MSRPSRLSTLLLEGAAIIASILLAFAIDAWWQERADRQDEQAAIRRLIVEYEQNMDELRDGREKHAGALSAVEKLLPMFSPSPIDLPADTAIGKLLLDTLQNPKLNPHLGATQSLIAAGQRSLIRDEEIQAMLTEWHSAAQEIIDWQVIERIHGEELILPTTFDAVAWPDVIVAETGEGAPSAFDSDYATMFTNRKLEGYYTNRRYNVARSIERIVALEEMTLALLEKLQSQLSD